MSESQLSLWLAMINLLVLAVMLVHLLLAAWRTAEHGNAPTIGGNAEVRNGGGAEAYTISS